MNTKYVFVTGGVASSLGKGIIAASLAKLLQARGLRVTIQKFDPYLNIDPGTLNPYEHGECYVTEDGAETDLDLGHYERFLGIYTSQANNVTTGRIYNTVISKEREGAYLGKTVQIVPHITDEIKRRMLLLGQTGDYDVIITEVGGTVGDMESQPFVEAMRQLQWELPEEDFLAAVDFLSNCDLVDPERIGIIGICGFGGMAVNAAALDPRIKATVASTMYDMSKVNVEGYFASEDTPAQRQEKRRALAAQRTKDYASGTYERAGGVIDPLPEDAPWFVKDYHAYYKTPRGYHVRSGNSNDGWNVIGCQSFMNQPLLAWAGEIENPVLLIHGEKAHSRYFSEYAFERMTGKHVVGESAKEGNKELLIIPGASHVDLYDDVAGVIPYDRIEDFFKGNLK